MATRPLLSDNEFNSSVYDLEGPEQLGLGTDAQNLLRRREAEERSDDYQGFRDFFKKIPEFGGKVVTGFADKNLQGLGFLSDVFGRTEGSETIARMRDQLYDPSKNAFLVGDQLNTKVGNLDPDKVSLKDQPKRGAYSPIAIEDRSVDDDVFNEEGPLGSMDQELIKKINSRDNFEAKRNLIDEEANLKTFPGRTDIIDIDTSTDQKTDPTEDLFTSAMQEFITGARGAGPDSPKEKTIEDYKKEFAKATGIDVSGKVDKSSALMAMGLALMQNKAGKGFNVGKILGEVGKAGEKALPKLEAAKAVARQGALAGGKYALQTKSADKATRDAKAEKAMIREQYYVYERGPDGEPFARLDKGDLVHLSKYELSELMNNPNFDTKYSFIKGKDYMDLKSSDKGDDDLGDPYGKETKVSLLGGDIKDINPIYIVDGQRPDGNYKGNKKRKSFLQSDATSVAQNLIKEQQSIIKEQNDFKGLIGNIQSGTSIPKQIGSNIIQFGRNLGLELGSGPTEISIARKKLERIQLLKATEILQESGKTLSDQDRERVKRYVGSIDLKNADDALIIDGLGYVYNLILKSRQRDLDTAVLNLNTIFGIKFDAGGDAPPTQAELDAMNKANNTKLTMADFKL